MQRDFDALKAKVETLIGAVDRMFGGVHVSENVRAAVEDLRAVVQPAETRSESDRATPPAPDGTTGPNAPEAGVVTPEDAPAAPESPPEPQGDTETPATPATDGGRA